MPMARRPLLPESRWVDLDGPVHYVGWEGPDDGPPFVLVHGLGGSHLNWLSVAPGLSRRGRVLALDLAGFGRTPLDARSATPHANRLLVDRFIREVAGGSAILVGNSMGGAIAMLEAAVADRAVSGLILTDPALPRARGVWPDPRVVAAFATNSIPGVGELVARNRARRLGPERLVRETLELCCVDASRIDPRVVEAHIDLAERRAEMGYAVAAFLRASRSLVRWNLAPKRARQVASSITAPTLVVHGARDRLVPLAAARELVRARPDFSLAVLKDAGHIPQLEVPVRWLEAVEAWLDRPEVAAEIIARAESVRAA